MGKKDIVDPSEFVRNDRRNWRDDELLAPGALLDFQSLADEPFVAARKIFSACGPHRRNEVAQTSAG
jgi:hypothetical protein